MWVILELPLILKKIHSPQNIKTNEQGVRAHKKTTKDEGMHEAGQVEKEGLRRDAVNWKAHYSEEHEAKNSASVFSSVQLLRHVQLFATPWTAAYQASLSITNSQSLLKLVSIEFVMPSNYLILCHSLLLPTTIFPSIRVFSKESALHIRWPKYWSFNFSISPSDEYSGLSSFRMNWLDLLAVQGSLKSLL